MADLVSKNDPNMPADLATTAASRAVSVTSPANPGPIALGQARFVLRGSEAMKAALQQARQQGWSPEQLAEKLEAQMPPDLEGSPAEVARYLADEHLQLGDGILLLDRRTLRAMYRLTDQDLWQPPPALRRDPDGSEHLVPRGPEIRPDLLAFLIEQGAEDERELNLQQSKTHLFAQTPLVAVQPPHSLQQLTQRGRTALVPEVEAGLNDVFALLRGPAAKVAACFTRVGTPFGTPEEVTVEYTHTVADGQSLNPRFDPVRNLLSALANGLLRRLCKMAAKQADIQYTVDWQAALNAHLDDRALCVYVMPVVHADVFVCSSESSVRLMPGTGELYVGPVTLYKRERHDKVLYRATWPVSLCCRADRVARINLTGLPDKDPDVEVI